MGTESILTTALVPNSKYGSMRTSFLIHRRLDERMKRPQNPSTVRNCRCADRRGAAMVEFALVCPLFLLLLGGIIEFGQAFRIQHALSNAARRGARSAIVEGTTVSTVKSTISAHCTKMLNVSAADIDITVAINGVSGGNLSEEKKKGDAILVTVSVPFSKAGVGFYSYIFPKNTRLSSSCILEHE
jgi:hypothetical protein